MLNLLPKPKKMASSPFRTPKQEPKNGSAISLAKFGKENGSGHFFPMAGIGSNSMADVGVIQQLQIKLAKK